MPDSMKMHPTPDLIVSDLNTGYSINVPAEWQDPNTRWWQDRPLAQRISTARVVRGIQLHDALWAYLNNQPEPGVDEDVYHFDDESQTYTRTDVRV